MEDALADAVDYWATSSVGRPTGKVREEAKRMKAICEQIAGSGNERIIAACLYTLDCYTLAL